MTSQVHHRNDHDPLWLAHASVDDAERESMQPAAPVHVVELLPRPRVSDHPFQRPAELVHHLDAEPRPYRLVVLEREFESRSASSRISAFMDASAPGCAR